MGKEETMLLIFRLHLMPDERRYLQSKQRKKTCNPYFDETLVFQVQPETRQNRELIVFVLFIFVLVNRPEQIMRN